MFAKPIKTLSKGYKQRVGLAQALLHRPPILILDEPMSGLDPNQAVEIRDLIKEIGRERTVVLSTHNLSEVSAACDRVLIISSGKIVADDTPQGLKERAGKQRYVVTLQKKDGIEATLEKLDGVERVRAESSDSVDEVTFEVLPSGSDDLRAPLFKAAVDNDYTLLEMAREGQNLEQIFRELTTSESSS
jgi:ABC-2 type transport system ATP-binding protein